MKRVQKFIRNNPPVVADGETAEYKRVIEILVTDIDGVDHVSKRVPREMFGMTSTDIIKKLKNIEITKPTKAKVIKNLVI